MIESTLDPTSPAVIWIVVLAFIIAFFLAFGVGANDVANSFGTSVGSKVLTLRQACILATIFEILGAMTLGYKVSSTIRTGMIDVSLFEGEEKRLMLGYLSSLIGGTIWNLVATFAGLPISGTHSIVGAIIGFSIVAKGFQSVKWMSILKIVASWFISPVLSGIVSVLLFISIKYLILQRENPFKAGLISLPLFYAFTVVINVFSIIHEGPSFLSYFTWWMALSIALGSGLITALFIRLFVVPRQKNNIIAKVNGDSSPNLAEKVNLNKDTNENLNKQNLIKTSQQNKEVNIYLNGKQSKEEHDYEEQNDEQNDEKDIESGKISKIDLTVDDELSDDKPEIAHLFTFLQILTACFGAFAHGGNDVSNAIGPLVAVMLIYLEGSYQQMGETPWYILLYGGIGISIGLWVWGRKVIKTMGNDLTKITPSSGFTIEIGAATTVLLASKIGLPISTTHCKVGSVVMVGRVRSKEGVNWSLFRHIAIAWVLTVPITALCSAGAMALLQLAA